MRRLTLIEDRPAEAPPGWEIYNAPRPLPGHTHWQGDYRHGIFFVAINPDDGEYSAQMRRQCANLDAYQVECITEEEARARCFAYYLEKYGDKKTFGPDPETKIREMVAAATHRQLYSTLQAIDQEKEKEAQTV